MSCSPAGGSCTAWRTSSPTTCSTPASSRRSTTGSSSATRDPPRCTAAGVDRTSIGYNIAMQDRLIVEPRGAASTKPCRGHHRPLAGPPIPTSSSTFTVTATSERSSTVSADGRGDRAETARSEASGELAPIQHLYSLISRSRRWPRLTCRQRTPPAAPTRTGAKTVGEFDLAEELGPVPVVGVREWEWGRTRCRCPCTRG